MGSNAEVGVGSGKGGRNMKSKPKETTKPNTPEQIMEQLQADLKHWQRELRLDGVEIKIEWIEENKNKGKKFDYCTLGYMEEFSGSFLYIIKIANQGKLKGHESAQFGEDYECILVHELIHVLNFTWDGNSKIASYLIPDEDNNEVLGQLYEASINALAEALVRARRGITR